MWCVLSFREHISSGRCQHMGCALPFAAQAALVQARLQEGLEVAVAWGLRAGLLETTADVGAIPQLSHCALAVLTAGGAGLVRVYGLVPVLFFPVLLLSFVARMSLGAYQAMNILLDVGLGATILLFLVLEDRFRRLFTKGCVRLDLRSIPRFRLNQP